METKIDANDEDIELRINSRLWEEHDVVEEEETDNMDEEELSGGSISSESEGSGADCASRIRLTKSVKDIWPTEEIILDLRKLASVEDTPTSSIKTDVLLKVPGGLLWACWLGRTSTVHKILLSGVSPHVKDDAGRTGMHLAALAGNADCLTTLLQKGANVNQWDKEQRVTPLHCAASSKSLPCVQILLNYGADVNAGLHHRSPLYYAVQSDSPECVSELLKKGASPDTLQVYTETPLHLAASRGLSECMSLLIRFGADARAQLGTGRSTALHLAAEEGHTECVRILLDAKALINATNTKLQTPLHLASIAQAADTLDILLQGGANTRAPDADGRTALHGALGRASRCADCVHLLLRARADVNQPDLFGYTPMHLAALNEFSSCVCLLLDNGGDVTLRTKGGHSVLSFIVRRTPEVIPKYISKFDDAIKVTDHEIGDVDCELKLDFRPLVPVVGRQEATLMLAFIEVGRRDVLKHPLCETFLYLKWRRIRKFFLSSLIYHTLFVILYSVYIIAVFLRNCPSTKYNVADNCQIRLYIILIGYLLISLNLLLLIKEVFQMFHDFIGYIKEWENWLQSFVIIGVFICSAPGSELNIQLDISSWKHHVAAVSIFLAWVELMIIVGRFPMFGLYVQMFRTVAVNFSKFLMAYSCLLIAFGLSFGVLFANYPSYRNVWLGLLKTVIMMSGELEFEDIFYNNIDKSPLLYPITAHIMFLLFVILVTVILTNLLVGLAVSDIQTLQESACLDRLVRQAELVARLESMLFSSLLYWVPPRLLAMLHRAALLMASRYQWALCIRPNDPRENRIPKDLIASVYKLVASKKEVPKSVKWSKFNMISPKNRHSTLCFLDNEKQQGARKNYSVLRPRTTSDLSHVQLRHQSTKTKDSDNRIILLKINDITVKLDKLQKLVEAKFNANENNDR